MKQVVFLGLLLLSSVGCSRFSGDITETAVNSAVAQENECPEKPGELEKSKVEEIDIDEKEVSKTEQIKAGEYKGYSFRGKANQLLSYNTEDDICLWIYTPANQLFAETELSETGKYTIQVSVLKGSKTFDLSMSLTTPTTDSESAEENLNSIQYTEPTSSASVSTSDQTSDRNYSPTTNSLTQAQALEVVEGWYAAKPKIFGYPYDEALVDKYATGRLYYETLEKEGEGSAGWLKRNDCYYDYAFSNIDNVWLFSTSGNRPSLKVQVSEKLQLHGPSYAGCSRSSNTYQKNVIYWFEQDNGTWKIYHYEVE